MNIEILKDLSDSNVKFYNGKIGSDIRCQTCSEIIADSQHLLIENNFYHKHHFVCSVCNVNLLLESETPFIRFLMSD